MSILSGRLVFFGLVTFTSSFASNAVAQARDTAAAKPVDHVSMTPAQHAAMHGGKSDSAFEALQARGKMAMGVDQYQSAHQFDVLPDGGRIALEMKDNDSLSIAQIRAHLKLIEHAFQAGDFSTPEFVHMRAMPGTDIMARRKNLIRYTYSDLPRGAQVTITTSDAASLQAIRQFMTAQRGDHKADGHDDEMQVAQFLIGTWNCAHTVGDFSGTYTTTYSSTLGNRWIKQTYAFPASDRRPGVEGEFLVGYDPRNGRWLRTGAMSDGLYFTMVGKRDGYKWSYGYVLPSTSGSATYTKKSDSEYTVDGPTYPERGRQVTEHHRCTKTQQP